MRIERYYHSTLKQNVLRIGNWHIMLWVKWLYFKFVIVQVTNFRKKNGRAIGKLFIALGIIHDIPVNKLSMKKEWQFIHTFLIGDAIDL